MYSFNYVEKPDFGYPTEITMTVPERTAEEMCDYFQRFLVATGFIFDADEEIHVIKKKKEEPEPMVFGKGDINLTDEGTFRVFDGEKWIDSSENIK